MIRKLTINWFKWLEDTTYQLWQDTLITWMNWEGKSRILEAIIYCLTWEVNWYKKKLDCSVSIEWEYNDWDWTYSMARIKWKVIWRWVDLNTKRLLCWIIPWYINRFIIKDKIDMLISKMWNREHNCATKHINNDLEYKQVSAKVKAEHILADKYAEEIINNKNKISELWDTNVGNLIDIKNRYDILVDYEKDIDLIKRTSEEYEENCKNIKELEDSLLWFIPWNSFINIKSWIQDKINKLELLKVWLVWNKITLESAEEWKCPTCEQDYINESKIEDIRSSITISETKIKELEDEELELQMTVIKESMKWYDNKYLQYIQLQTLKAKEFTNHIATDVWYSLEEKEELELKLSNFEELFSKSQQVKLLTSRNQELWKLIGDLSAMDYENELVDYKDNERFYYESITNTLNDTFDFDIELFQKNASNDWYTIVFNISKDWIDYFWLSSGQQLLIDVEISKYITNEDYFLIDNWERISNRNIKTLFSLAWDRQVIMTKVTQWKLKVETD